MLFVSNIFLYSFYRAYFKFKIILKPSLFILKNYFDYVYIYVNLNNS